jgi:hypothetical protein
VYSARVMGCGGGRRAGIRLAGMRVPAVTTITVPAGARDSVTAWTAQCDA